MRTHRSLKTLAALTALQISAACGDATRALSPDRASDAASVPVEREESAAARRDGIVTFPARVIADLPIVLTPDASVAGADFLSYEWVFEDGTTARGVRVEHSFPRTGRSNVRLRATRANGTVVDLFKSIEVTAGITALATAQTGVVPGGTHTCAIDIAALLWCWGDNGNGNLGDGSRLNRMVPVLVAGGISFSQVASGFAHSCALTTAGVAYCWGRNTDGQLGNGTQVDRDQPVQVMTGLTFSSIDVGYNHSCAVESTTSLAYCWGANDLGQIGDGGALPRQLLPTAVLGTVVFQFVRSGYYHTCGLSTAGNAYCWGSNANGQIGNGGGGVSTTDKVTSPTMVAGGQLYIALDVGGTHSCAIVSDKKAYCWGTNTSGQLGSSSGTVCRTTVPCNKTPNRLPSNLRFEAISLGTSHSCAIVSTGQTYCWGNNASGQLGDGTTINRLDPTLIAGPTQFKKLRGGGAYTCGISISDQAYCWGSNISGKLGLGDTADRLTATLVPGLQF